MKTEKNREKITFFTMTGILLMTAIISLAFILMKGSESGRRAVIISEGKVIGRYDLDLMEGEKRITIQPEGSRGFNEILISKEGVCITDSDCKGKDCIKTGTISHSGETIACLPNRLIITITSDDEYSGYDARTY